MALNIPPDEIRRRLILFLRIPNEVWTDVLKLLPRQILVKRISSICYRIKEICNKNVKNIHVIKKANKFAHKLKEDDPEANRRLWYLSANNCQLAGEFRLIKLDINEKSKVILRHCLDLFKGCEFYTEGNIEDETFFECLTCLESAKPIAIQDHNLSFAQFNKFMQHPTVWNCNRVDMWIKEPSKAKALKISKAIFDWLHFINDDDAADAAADPAPIRCFIFFFYTTFPKRAIKWLLNQCTENFQQSQAAADRRQFMLSFGSKEDEELLQEFAFENQSTGEVLMLERATGEDSHTTGEHRLRRCLAHEVANGKEFYAKLLKRDAGFDEFRIEDGTTEVTDCE